ncbi:RNA-directed DNA polymerase, eukaryota [Tanacetum coccineum]
MDSRECSGVLIVCIGANNDLNVLYGSPLFDDELVDTAPECPFVVNGHTYRKCYYLADGIYPAWFTFVKSFSVARDEKSLKFKRVQEAARKDIERAFGVLQVNIFSWRARRDRLPTRVNLSRRGVLLDSHMCPLCNAAMEDVQHVFFRCDVARVVFRKICRWWDLDWQEICSFSDWDAWFLSFRLSFRLKFILEGVFYVAWWRIWRLRNQLVFDASSPNCSTIFDDIVSWSFLWCSSRCNKVFS